MLAPESFDELYPVFLLRKVGQPAKASLWKRYLGRWVRWRGRIASFTNTGATIKMLPKSITFDVSVVFDAPGRVRLHHYRVGDEIRYVGRLSAFDDVFRTFYLTQGDVGEPPTDAGAPPQR